VSAHDIVNDPLIVRALFLAIEALTDHDIPPLPDASQKHLRRAGQSWSEQEDEQLRQEFSRGINLQIITEIHCRTQGAIASRLVHLQLVNRRDEVRKLLAWS